MTDRIWVGAFGAMAFNKIGLRHKFPGQPWEAPYKNHIVPARSPEFMDAFRRYSDGELVEREAFSECSAIYDAKRFAREKEFSRAGLGYIVDARVAELLEPFDLGPGGIFPYAIYEADEQTPIKDQWWMLGLGAQKRSFRPDKSKHAFLECLFDGKGERDSSYGIMLPMPEDEYLAFSPAALEGADLWTDRELYGAFCFSDRLGQALQEAGLAHWFNLHAARIVD